MSMKHFLMAAALVSIMSTAAIAEETTAAAAPAAAEKSADKEAAKTENFAARKAKVQKHLSERLSTIQQRQTCVNAAANPDALKACFPARKGKGEHKPKMEQPAAQ